MSVKRSKIPQPMECISKEYPYIGGAKDIHDDTLGKTQEELNAEMKSITDQMVVAIDGGSVELTADPDDIVVGSGKVPTANAIAGKFNTKQDVIDDLSAIRSGAAAGATAYQKPGTGVPKTDLSEGVQRSLDAANEAAPQSTTYTKTEVDNLLGAEEQRARVAEGANANDIDTIEGKIPAQASQSNQLADKAFVNSSVATATATFRGTYNLVSDLSLTTSATHAQIATALATKMAALGITPDDNDYCYVLIPTADATPAQIEAIERYKHNGTAWAFEYELNNSGFTAAQWAAINSGITSALVTKLGALPTAADLTAALLAKQDVISDLATIRSGAAAGATALQPAALNPYSTTEQMNSAIGQAVNAEKERAEQAEGANAAAITQLQNIVADLETIAEGYVRVAGSSNPALSYRSYKYHEQGAFGRESVFHLFCPCLVGTKLSGNDAQVGKILFVLKKFGAKTVNGTPMWEDVNGNMHAIDGTEGDIMICNTEPYYAIDGKHTIDGTEYDVFLKSRTPFTWQGIDAEHVERWGHSPDYCISHLDTDNVQRMHSVYNPAWNGSYQVPDAATVVGKYVYSQDAETGIISETYDENETLMGGAGGCHTTDKALYTGEQEAMNQNPDTTKCVPFMNETAHSVEQMFAMMLSEGGTFDAHNASLMGSGFCGNDTANAAADWEESGTGAKNGLRVIDKDGNPKYFSLAADIHTWNGKSSGFYAGQIVNSWRNPWKVMEAVRAVSYAIQNDVHELEWFVFEGNKYKWRSVTGFAGPAQGEMTCVVWKMLSTKAAATVVDPTDKQTSIEGNRMDILISTALFHGITTQVSPSWWTSGLIFTEFDDGHYECYMERDQAKLIKSENGEKLVSESYNFETAYQHVGSFANGSGYRKDYSNVCLMLPDKESNKTGGGLHTYVGAYNYFTGTAASSGKKLVRGVRRGYGASYAGLSPLCVYAYYAPSLAITFIAFGTCVRITES